MHKLTQHKKIIFGLTLAVVAGIFSVNVWSGEKTPLQETVLKKGPTLPEEVVPTMSYHQGKQTLTIPYLEDDILYLSEIEKHGTSTDAEVSRKKVAENVIRLLGVNKNTGQFLYLISGKESTSGEDFSGVGLWMSDRKGNTKEVYRGVADAALSPSGTRIVLSDVEFKIRIIDLKGNLLATIPGHGSGAIFSPDGTKIAYQKLSETGPFTDTWLLGLSVVDLSKGEEIPVEREPGDYGVVGFSTDGSKLYFLKSGKEDVSEENVSRGDLFVSDLDSRKEALILTASVKNFRPHLPAEKNSFDNVFYFEDEEGVAELKFSPQGFVSMVRKLKDEDVPSLLEQEKKLIVRKKGADGKEHWQSVDVQ